MNEEASLNLNFTLAKDDSPQFRANLQRLEDEIEKVSTWMDSVCKALKTLLDEMNSTDIIMVQGALSELVDENLSMNALRTFSDAVLCIFSFNAKLQIDDLQEYLLAPLLQFSKEDVKDMREQRRIYERIVDRYENSLQKYSSQSRSKDASGLREDAFQLYDLRKLYVRTSMDYTTKAVKFKYALDKIILDRFTDSMDSISEFYNSASEVYKGLSPRITQLKDGLHERQSGHDKRLELLEKERLKLEEDVINEFRPSNTLPVSGQTQTKSSFDANTPIDKEGYLFKKIPPKPPMLTPTWGRRWCYIKDGKFGYRVQAKTRKGMIASVSPISVLLCEVKIDDKQDRRYTFEVLSSRRSFILQAETEEEMFAWLNVFEAAKSSLIKLGKKVEDETVPDNRGIVDDEDFEILTTPPLTRKSIGATKKYSSEQTNSLPTIMYPDVSFERKHEELRSVIKSWSPDDALIDSFPIIYKKDSGINGRIYLTLQSVIFYSNILNFVTTVIIPLRDITSIDRQKEDSQNLIIIKMGEESHIFKTMHGDEVRIFGALNTLYWNTKSENPMQAQEIFDNIYESYKSIPAPVVSGEEDSPVKTRRTSKPSLKDPSKGEASPKAATSPQAANAAITTEEEWPSDLPLPTAEVKCECTDHPERTEISLVLDVSAQKLYKHLFDSDFFSNYHTKKGDWDVSLTPWSADPQPKRELKWMFNVNNPMVKIKETECQETQILLKKQDHILYVVDTLAKTPNMPYGDAFQTVIRFCITYVSKTSCKVVINIGVTWFKNPMVKAIIKNAAMKGMSDNLQDLVKKLKSEVLSTSGSPIAVSGAPEASAEKAPSTSAKPLGSQSVSVTDSSWFDMISNWGIVILLVVSILLNLKYMFLHPPTSASTTATTPRSMFQPSNGIHLIDIQHELFNKTLHVGRDIRDESRKKRFEEILGYAEETWTSPSMKSRADNDLKLIRYAQTLRMNMITSFESLNELETNLLKDLYMIWMKDQLKRCLKRLNAETIKDEKQKLEHACGLLEKDLAVFTRGL